MLDIRGNHLFPSDMQCMNVENFWLTHESPRMALDVDRYIKKS